MSHSSRSYICQVLRARPGHHAQNGTVPPPDSEALATEGEPVIGEGLPDFGALTLPFEFTDHEALVTQR